MRLKTWGINLAGLIVAIVVGIATWLTYFKMIESEPSQSNIQSPITASEGGVATHSVGDNATITTNNVTIKSGGQ